MLAAQPGIEAGQKFRQWLIETVRRRYGSKLLLCLDGLDEVRPADAQAVLDAVEEVTRKDPQLAVVVTDRVTRRAVELDRWALFGVDLRGGSLRGWETFPFFRDKGIEAASRSEAIRQLAARAAPVIADDLGAVASKAFVWLEREDSTAAASEDVRELLGAELTAHLQEADLLTVADSAFRFMHPLYHAYFAANHLHTRTEDWHEETWDALTVEGASFSALGLLLEQVKEEDVDRLVRAIDKWNYLAAASLLAEDLAGAQRVPEDLRSALLLLLGHRRFSPVLNTALFAGDMLGLQVGDELARRALEAANRAELVRLAAALPDYGSWWREWRTTFSSRDDEMLLEKLSDDDYLVAWTASNVLSSFEHDGPAAEKLLRLASASEHEDVRWRALHALSSSRDPRVAARCLEMFQAASEDEWVRYGALRVYLQVVANMDDVDARRELCMELASVVDTIRGVSRWEREIERAAELRDAPADWPDTFGIVIGALWTGAASLEEEDRWRAAAAALQTDQDQPFPAALRPMPDEDEV
ncbi:hypothetical protein MIC448_230001 [Microbacterium sp. C448]|nr:hypothetical protein MIC448_230001 [Microbacterium sp. C448]